MASKEVDGPGGQDTLRSTLGTFGGTARFQVRRLIGSGGMGLVYHVHDSELSKDLALKTLRRVSAEQLYHLKSEFRSLAAVSHRNLVQLHELFNENGEIGRAHV